MRAIPPNLRVKVVGLFTFLIFMATQVPAQPQSSSGTPPSLCRAWDEMYLSLFYTGFWVILAGSFFVSLLVPPMLAKAFWWATSPGLRILIITFAIWFVITFCIALWPRIFGFGPFWFSGIDNLYLECATTRFGASGLFGGLIGYGVPAIAQWTVMIAFFSLAAFCGGVGAWIASVVLNRYSGVRSTVKGEAL